MFNDAPHIMHKRRRRKRGGSGLRKARCVLKCRKNGGKLKGCRRKCKVKKGC